MSSQVFFGSPRQARLEAKETLPAKLDLILERLHLRDRVKDETVAIKMHTGNNIGYSTVHPVFVRKVVQAVKDGGGKPFVADVNWDAKGAEERGYSSETLGCPVYPAAGPDDKYFYPHERPYKNIKTWKVAGMIQDATFLINLAHVKGHPSCGYGGAFKNLALGCMVGETRSAMHDTMHFDRYWFAEKCPDAATRKRIIEACPHEAIVEDKNDPKELHLHPEQCNQCGRCLQVAPPGSLKIDAVNFHAFQEACAISASISLVHLRAGQGHPPRPGHAHDAGVRLLWLYQHAHPAGCGHLRLGRHRGARPGGAGRDRAHAADRGEHPDLDGSPHARGAPVPLAARAAQGPLPGGAVRRATRAGHARVRAG